ncbi:MAG: hypothetical protein RIB32_00500 [Phycisphaerales bacterium]
MNAIEKLRQQTDLIRAADDGFKVVDAWALVGRLIGRMPVDQTEATRVVAEKDAEGLDALVRGLENPEPAAPPPAQPTSEFTLHELNDAMRAFRKRVKAARLADESKLRGHYTTSGKPSGIDAIEPPREYPMALWRQLARQGRLEDTGQGFFREPPNPPKLG